jgi:hypothetical protein
LSNERSESTLDVCDQGRWAQSAASSSVLARGHKVEAGRNRDELRKRSHTHLAHHPSTLLNGDFADTEPTANLPVQQAANHQRHGIAYAEVPSEYRDAAAPAPPPLAADGSKQHCTIQPNRGV